MCSDITAFTAIRRTFLVRSIAPSILTLALQWSDSRPNRLTPGENAPSTHWVGGWLGPRAGLDAVEKRKIPATARNRNPAFQPVARRYTDCGFPSYIK
jgi:hypothetical protein